MLLTGGPLVNLEMFLESALQMRLECDLRDGLDEGELAMTAHYAPMLGFLFSHSDLCSLVVDGSKVGDEQWRDD